MCLGSLSFCGIQIHFIFRSRTDGWTFLFRMFCSTPEFMVPFQVLRQQNNPRPTHYHHLILLLVWCSSSEMLLFFMPHIMGHTHFPSSTFFSSVHRVFSQVVENIENRINGFFPLNSKHIHLETTYCIFKIVWWSATVWQTHKKKIGNSFSHHCILYWVFSS